MIEIDTKLKAWGNSIGIIIPKYKLKNENLDVDDEVEVILKKKRNVVKETFGTYKFSKSTDKLMKEINEALDPK
jgi:antitoxin component of MazEF toxin-antitoxin module